MKHIDKLIEELELEAMASQEAGRDDKLSMQAAGEIRRLKMALEDANGMCRSAKQIANRLGKETNWEAFNGRLDESLQRQHEVMFPGENADVEATRGLENEHE